MLMDELYKLARNRNSKAIGDLEKRPILHNTVCEKHEMKEQLEKILDL